MDYELIKFLTHEIRRTISLVSEKEKIDNVELTEKTNKIKKLINLPVKKVNEEVYHD